MSRPNPFPQDLDFGNAGFHGGKRLLYLRSPFQVRSSMGGFTVPEGFIFDGGSIPRLAQSIVGHPFDEYLEDCVAHDWLYHPGSDGLGFSRADADFILKETFWNRRLPLWKQVAFYSAVRSCGWASYKKR